MTISQSIADLINSWGWLLVIGIFFGGGDVIARILDGRRKRAVLKTENTALKAENKRLNSSMMFVLEKGGDPALITQDMMLKNGKMADLLGRVQASDQVVPQLPQQLRDDIDSTLEARWVTTRPEA